MRLAVGNGILYVSTTRRWRSARLYCRRWRGGFQLGWGHPETHSWWAFGLTVTWMDRRRWVDPTRWDQ